jgi:phage gpG-like protein
MEIHIDSTQVTALAKRYRGAGAIVRSEMLGAMQRSTFRLEGQAKKEAPVRKRNGGTLRRSITSNPVTPTLGIVGTNVPYAKWVHNGRGPITAGPGKMLRFEIGGEVFFRKSVGPAKANPFMKRALASQRGAIRAEWRGMAARIAARLRAG